MSASRGFLCLFLECLWLTLSDGARVLQSTGFSSHSEVKYMSGVPVYHYGLAFNEERAASFLQEVKGETRAGREHWIIYLHPGIKDARIKAICKLHHDDCKLSGSSKGVPFLEYRGTEKDLGSLLEALQHEVEFAELDLPNGMIPEMPSAQNMKKKTVGDNGEKPKGSWGLDRIGAEQRKQTGKGVHLYIMDTGVRTTHQEFGGRAIPTLDMTQGDLKECKGDVDCATDGNGHGTHCAGTAASTNFGVAPGATVHAVKVLRDSGKGASTWALAALDWVVTKGERPAVASMSLGSMGQSHSDKAAIDRAVAGGVTVIVAAGNDMDDACHYQPSFVPNAIAVAASTTQDRPAFYTNYGPCVSLFAPGDDIVSLGLDSDSDTAILSGTSMATPHVAGATALFLEETPSLTPRQVLTKLQTYAMRDIMKGNLKHSPNLLLSIPNSGKTPWIPIRNVPTPAPLPLFGNPLTPEEEARMTKCPPFSSTKFPSLHGDCRCPDGQVCHTGDKEGCAWSMEGFISRSQFQYKCTECNCRTPGQTPPVPVKTEPPLQPPIKEVVPEVKLPTPTPEVKKPTPEVKKPVVNAPVVTLPSVQLPATNVPVKEVEAEHHMEMPTIDVETPSVNLPRVCPSSAKTPNPDMHGDCECPVKTKCHTGEKRGCASVTGLTTDKYFAYSCKICKCKM